MDATPPVKVLFVCVKKGVRAAIAKRIVELQSNGWYTLAAVVWLWPTPPSSLRELPNMLDVAIIIGESKTVFEYKD